MVGWLLFRRPAGRPLGQRWLKICQSIGDAKGVRGGVSRGQGGREWGRTQGRPRLGRLRVSSGGVGCCGGRSAAVRPASDTHWPGFRAEEASSADTADAEVLLPVSSRRRLPRRFQPRQVPPPPTTPAPPKTPHSTLNLLTTHPPPPTTTNYSTSSLETFVLYSVTLFFSKNPPLSLCILTSIVALLFELELNAMCRNISGIEVFAYPFTEDIYQIILCTLKDTYYFFTKIFKSLKCFLLLNLIMNFELLH